MAKPHIPWKSGLRIGILGGGQLARMLGEAAHAMGVRPVIFDGKLDDRAGLRNFLDTVEVVIFENEFVDGAALESGGGPSFFPSIATLEIFRDKANQKRLLQKIGVPTARTLFYDGKEAIEAWLRRGLSTLGGQGVLKWSRLGYDGKGVFQVGSSGELPGAKEFCEAGLKVGAALLFEERIAFRRELAIVACRGRAGEMVSWPVVVSEQMDNVCVRVRGPALSLGLEPRREEDAKRYAEAIAREGELYGTFAVELFETAEGLLVNKIAPRVHNSGHFTQEASRTSQFENHVRAAIGLALGDTTSAPAFAMRNVLGPAGITRPSEGAPLPAPTSGIHLHWYDKGEIRPGRKLGHLNASGADRLEIDRLAAELETAFEAWVTKLRGG